MLYDNMKGVAAFVSFMGPSLQRGKQGSTKQNDKFHTMMLYVQQQSMNKVQINLSFLDMPLLAIYNESHSRDRFSKSFGFQPINTYCRFKQE